MVGLVSKQFFFCKIPLCGTLSAPPTHGNSNSKVPWEMGRFVVVTISAASRTPATFFFSRNNLHMCMFVLVEHWKPQKVKICFILPSLILNKTLIPPVVNG